MKRKLNYFVFLIVILNQTHLYSQATTLWNYDTSFYFYKMDSHSNAENLITEKIIFDSKLTKKEVLDSIATFLTNTYFIPRNKYYETKRKISIDIKGINEINLSNRIYSIATVNIDDPDKICMGSYFQGSTGGYITFLLLVSNLLQPQLEIPLLDGIIFLYNNEELQNMDHINLEGLISEREIDNKVRRAVKN
ncbi:MAG: hypothetical protein WBN42_11270 [Ignavibacteriaceae bacterium]